MHIHSTDAKSHKQLGCITKSANDHWQLSNRTRIQRDGKPKSDGEFWNCWDCTYSFAHKKSIFRRNNNATLTTAIASRGQLFATALQPSKRQIIYLPFIYGYAI